jgi:uncharacterized membrane protein (TIGR02234 family)
VSERTARPGAGLRGRALVPGLLGGALTLVTAAQPWWRATAEGVDVAFSGTETTAGLASALGVVALAGWLLVLVLRTRGRQVVGVLLALAGAGTVVVGALGLRPSEAAVRSSVRAVSLVESYGLVPTGWSWGHTAAGALVLTGGLLVALTAPRWPARPDRFTRTAEVAAATTAEDDPAAVWRAQDAGLDPTTVPAPEAPSAPDVRPGHPRDRMGGAERPWTPPAE